MLTLDERSSYKTGSKRKRQLTKVPIGCLRPPAQWNEEELAGIVATTLILNEEQVLPLQEACQAQVEANGMDRDVHSAASPEIVVCKLGNQGVGVLDDVL